MFTGPEIVATLGALGVTHVVWLPDSEIGRWEKSLEDAPHLSLVRVCREGEAWLLAAGLWLGGKSPLVVMQSTGFFESGDAMRNVLFDMKLPISAIIGHRSYLVEGSADSARRFAEPVLAAWGLDYALIARPQDKSRLAEHLRSCRDLGQPGFVLMAEGRT
jgi:sulfopyruvate decarboxylase TPP-binding subunit